MTYPHNDDNRPPDDETPDLPAGEYPVRAVNHRIGEAGTGTYQIGVRCKITRGAHAGKTALWYGSFTDASEEMTIRGMKALGHRSDDIFDCRGFYEADAPEAIAVVEHERNPKTQRLQAKIKFINGGDIMMARDLSEADQRRFADRMRAVLKRHGGPSARPSDPTPTRRDDRPPPDQRANPAPGRGYGDSYNGPARGAAPVDDRRPPPPDDRDMPWNGRRS